MLVVGPAPLWAPPIADGWCSPELIAEVRAQLAAGDDSDRAFTDDVRPDDVPSERELWREEWARTRAAWRRLHDDWFLAELVRHGCTCGGDLVDSEGRKLCTGCGRRVEHERSEWFTPGTWCASLERGNA